MHLSKFIDRLPILPVASPNHKDGQYTYYEMKMTQFKQSLHSELPDTTVWGFQGMYPGPTIEVESGERTFVKWSNQLPPTHLFPIDHTVHGAGWDVPLVRTVTHLHGASVESESDGYPEAWFTEGYKEVGSHFHKPIYRYDNVMRPCTLWYHDHALGITRLNVYAGLAGFYLIRDQQERLLNLPHGKFDIPLMIQDKSFHVDGSLSYPIQPDTPVADLDVSIAPAFLGDTILVNGKVWPYLDVEARKYRFRVLNASNTRFYRLRLEPSQFMYQIGTDGGLMQHPIAIKELILAPAERAEIIIDFTNLTNKNVRFINDAPYPFPYGKPIDVDTVGNVMEFRVTLPLSSIDSSMIPSFMKTFQEIPTDRANIRHLTLDERIDQYGRHKMLLDDKGWNEPISLKPKLGQTEIWYLINRTENSHPIHVHLVDFQIIDRRMFDAQTFNQDNVIVYTSEVIPPLPQERGWKDTVIAYPNQITKIIMKFGPYTGLYVWHCHILEHEDYVMMRPIRVIP